MRIRVVRRVARGFLLLCGRVLAMVESADRARAGFRGKTFFFAEQAEEQMLGANVLVREALGFFGA